MVHFPGFARTRLWIHRAVVRFCRTGFPHSEIPGSKPTCGSPRLIAACHVLHRHHPPRHSPCALSSLTIKFTQRTRPYGRLRTQTLWRHFLLITKFRFKELRTSRGTHKIYSPCTCIYPIYSVVKHRPRRIPGARLGG
jgi:hypothetical protein